MPVFLSQNDIAAWGDGLEEHRGALLNERYLPRLTAFPGVRALFERVQADGLRIALASSAKEDELETYKRVAERLHAIIRGSTLQVVRSSLVPGT